MELKILLAIIMIAATANVTIGLGSEAAIKVYAEKSPYQSGFSHGEEDCNDIKDGVPQEDVYIFKDKYGPDKHTQVFMDGFYEGWYSAGCPKQDLNHMLYLDVDVSDDNVNYESNTAVDDSFNNRDSVVQPQSQSAITTQSAGCSKMIINGDCVIGQDQNVENNLGQANRAEN